MTDGLSTLYRDWLGGSYDCVGRVRGYAKAHGIPVIDCSVGQRKHELAEEYLAKTKITQGLFLVLVGRAPAVVWTVGF